MKLIAAKDYDEMSEIAARYFAAQVLLKPTSVFGFATGSTPIGLYKALIRKNAEGKITFKYAHTVNMVLHAGGYIQNNCQHRLFNVPLYMP